MAAHETVRLEKEGVVVAYFAPNANVDPIMRDELRVAPVSGSKAPISRDNQMVLMEVNIDGRFIHSDALPSAHKTDLEALFGGPVTPIDQKLRLMKYLWIDGGPFDFYMADEEFTATTNAGIDIEAGVWPQVNIIEIAAPQRGGLEASWLQYSVKLSVGLPTLG